MKVLVLGATGMLGFALHRMLADDGWHVTGAVRSAHSPKSNWCGGLNYLTQVDAEDIYSVIDAIERTQSTLVINAIGVKTVRDDEKLKRMLMINSSFPRRLAFVTERLGVRLIHFSSDGVFNGTHAPYTENDIPNADDIYGISKYLGEPDGNHILTIRTSLLGRSLTGTGSLIDWMLSQSGKVKGYRCAVFSGLPVNEIGIVLTKYILPKLESVRGLFHLSSMPINKADLLKLVSAAWDLYDVNIEQDDSVVINRSLDSERLMNLIGYNPPLWPQLVTSMREFYDGLEKKGRAV